MSIAIDIQKEGDWDIVSYRGPINEESEVHLNKILQTLGPKVRVNFSQVSMVNSCGVRSWVNFMREAEQGREISYTECTSEIVMQINMIPSFRGRSDIESVYGSYTCENCGHNQNILFEKGRNMPASEDDEVDPPACPKCNEEMEMEELEEEFFAFVAA
jgi:anti-anti-sigma regulatory factor/DNA-directed RNA polymerase subunit RPC12/RpoP